MQKVEKSGADCLLMCSNTVHLFAEEVESAISIPLLHIGDVSAKEMVDQNIKRIGLLGTETNDGTRLLQITSSTL